MKLHDCKAILFSMRDDGKHPENQTCSISQLDRVNIQIRNPLVKIQNGCKDLTKNEF